MIARGEPGCNFPRELVRPREDLGQGVKAKERERDDNKQTVRLSDEASGGFVGLRGILFFWAPDNGRARSASGIAKDRPITARAPSCFALYYLP